MSASVTASCQTGVMSLVEAERRRVKEAANLDAARQVHMGQFFTPAPVAEFMASLFEFAPGPGRLLDPGAGVGQLAAAFADRWAAESSHDLEVTAVEADSSLHASLRETLDQMPTPGELVAADYLQWTQRSLFNPGPSDFDYIIMNPPYAKLNVASQHRRILEAAGVEVTNLYAAFVAMAIRQLKPGGQIVAITPRSFANGPYFRAFRRDLLERVGLRQIHVFDSRDSAFSDSAVLQENVIFHAEFGRAPKAVAITSSHGPGDTEIRRRDVPMEQVVDPSDPDSFIHLATDEASAELARIVARQPETLGTLGLAVSTGRVVDFRCKDALREEWSEGEAPLLYPAHLSDSRIEWPKTGKKANGLRIDDKTAKMLIPAGHYVLIKRFSSKEERRRIVAALLSPEDLPSEAVAVENHLNFVHCGHKGLERNVALGLATWLNSTVFDTAFRQFSGHTQVNATDLRSMRFPAVDTLRELGRAAGTPTTDQTIIDDLVDRHVIFVRAS
jgi:adenine-specific DNA-methyltransferase